VNDDKHIIDDLARDNPYRVPEGYYSDMQQQVLGQVSLPSERGYSLPDDYWEEMQANVMTKLPKQAKTAKMLTLRRSLLAAASVAVLLLALIALPYESATEKQAQYAELSDEDIELYLLESADELSLEQLAELADDSQLTSELDIDYDGIDELLEEITLDDLDELL